MSTDVSKKVSEPMNWLDPTLMQETLPGTKCSIGKSAIEMEVYGSLQVDKRLIRGLMDYCRVWRHLLTVEVSATKGGSATEGKFYFSS